jgi:hypothetical protein
VDYNFVDEGVFRQMVSEGAFIEWADVFGNLYGTSVVDTEAQLVAGQDVVLVIDVQGAHQVRQRFTNVVSIFLLPPSYSALQEKDRYDVREPLPHLVRSLHIYNQHDILSRNQLGFGVHHACTVEVPKNISPFNKRTFRHHLSKNTLIDKIVIHTILFAGPWQSSGIRAGTPDVP